MGPLIKNATMSQESQAKKRVKLTEMSIDQLVKLEKKLHAQEKELRKTGGDGKKKGQLGKQRRKVSKAIKEKAEEQKMDKDYFETYAAYDFKAYLEVVTKYKNNAEDPVEMHKLEYAFVCSNGKKMSADKYVSKLRALYGRTLEGVYLEWQKLSRISKG